PCIGSLVGLQLGRGDSQLGTCHKVPLPLAQLPPPALIPLPGHQASDHIRIFQGTIWGTITTSLPSSCTPDNPRKQGVFIKSAVLSRRRLRVRAPSSSLLSRKDLRRSLSGSLARFQRSFQTSSLKGASHP